MDTNGVNDEGVVRDNDAQSIIGDSAQESQGGGLPKEVYSKKIRGRSRVFFVDLKESSYGRFLKISEKSRGGQKTTVMMDEEDVPALIEALSEIRDLL